jgi:CRISPR-associated endonuclease/helicase Cas3
LVEATVRRALAHSLEGRPESAWEPVDEHLREVAAMAGRFAGAFALPVHGRLAGIWHDLGKYSAEFQDRIRAGSDASLETLTGRVDHSTFGARHAHRTLGRPGWLLAYCIAGHHAGLADAIASGHGASALEKRLSKADVPPVPAPPDSVESPPQSILRSAVAEVERLVAEFRSLSFDEDEARRAFQVAFVTRMVFSALVDADSLCTEQFCSPDRATERSSADMPLQDLATRLRAHVDPICRTDTDVNRARAEVLDACRAKAQKPPGVFSLTVPTGGGKTLSSLSFALEHSAVHGLRRVIYAIPFTSIIEQNAAVIRNALERQGERVVLEHHSNLAPDRETRWSSRAAENWDAAVVVTTNVQLFDSLFASSRSRCRRLHRLAQSVIVLDEAQSLPVHVLAPCLAALRELARNYGCTVVLCTATQPAIERRSDFAIGLEGVHEIIDDVPALFAALRRTRVELVGTRSDEDLVDRLVEERQALCIVNTRAHAAELFGALRERRADGLFHLSALMCASHRSQVLARVLAARESGGPCVLISSQVIEAGVDVDFPVVLRAMAGIDSIAQAAGRCNREGKLDSGTVEVFETDRRASHAVAGAASDAREILPDHVRDPLSPAAVEAYFALHYWQRSQDWDKRDVLRCFRMSVKHPFHADFRDAASRFRMIEDVQVPVLVPHGEGRGLIDELCRTERPDRDLLRRLQRYIVGVYERDRDAMLERQVIFDHEGIFVLANSDAYDAEVGLLPTAGSGFDPMIA